MKQRFSGLLSHMTLVLFIGILGLPLYLAVVVASHSGATLVQGPLPYWPGTQLLHNMHTVLTEGLVATGGQATNRMLLNSFIMALCIAIGKVGLALLSAFSLVYFDLPFKKGWFALIFATMMLPVEVRIVPTFQVIASFGWLNSYVGLTLPLMASATATFLFQQFFKTVPSALVDAAILDGAGPIRFFIDILLPLSRNQMAAMGIVLFVYGWNQYLWPLVMTTDPHMATMVMGVHTMAGVSDQVPAWHEIMAVVLLALAPPCLVVLVLRRWFIQGFKD